MCPSAPEIQTSYTAANDVNIFAVASCSQTGTSGTPAAVWQEFVYNFSNHSVKTACLVLALSLLAFRLFEICLTAWTWCSRQLQNIWQCVLMLHQVKALSRTALSKPGTIDWRQNTQSECFPCFDTRTCQLDLITWQISCRSRKCELAFPW